MVSPRSAREPDRRWRPDEIVARLDAALAGARRLADEHQDDELAANVVSLIDRALDVYVAARINIWASTAEEIAEFILNAQGSPSAARGMVAEVDDVLEAIERYR